MNRFVLGEFHESSQWIPTAGSFHKPKLFGNLIYVKRPIFIETFNDPTFKLRSCNYSQKYMEKNADGVSIKKERLCPERISYKVEDGRLKISSTFLPALDVIDTIEFSFKDMENLSNELKDAKHLLSFVEDLYPLIVLKRRGEKPDSPAF